ncbi:FMN-dependent NADH-azoreductase [Xanthomonas sacchari]|uniref:FMN-dependent NADH-azoreductase n=1 Tax=Xanthomonas sacchari TaxID=56458 RepID=UPI003527685F
MNLLHIDSSILDGNSVSRTLSAQIVAHLSQQHVNLAVTHLDLAATPLAHLNRHHLAAFQGNPAPEHLDAQTVADIATGLRSLDDFLAADIVVLGVPMYNFGVPSQLKAWLDRIAVAGKTFRYGAQGPEGLCVDKRVVIASSRGGVLSEGSPLAAMDHQEQHLLAFFRFLGITDIAIVRAEGLAMGEDMRAIAMANAQRDIASLALAAA